MDFSALRTTGWRHPLPSHTAISSKFGASRPGTRPPECGAGHCGVDFKAPVGTPVYAIHDAVVLTAERNEVVGGAAGRFVKLKHAGDLVRSWYIHLDQVSVNKGQKVAAGQRIGTVGLTGVKQSPPHLHFALAVPATNGAFVYTDPEPWAKTWAAGNPNAGGGLVGFALASAFGLLLWRSLR